MDFITDNRGVSEVIGAILVFGLLITLLAVFQTVAVPAANEEIEFEHNQDAQNDFVKFHESATRIGSTGRSESVGIRAGTGYPTRLLFFNPSDPAGAVRTTDSRSVTFRNITATEPETRDYFNGTVGNINGSGLSYSVDYNEYQNAPTTNYEYGLLYNDFGEEQVIRNSGSIVEGSDISLTFLSGNLSTATSHTLSLNVRPTSAPSRTIPITANETTRDNITLILPTNLSIERWNETLIEEDNVLNVSTAPNGAVNITLRPEDASGNLIQYDVRMSRLGVGSDVPEQEPQYVTTATTKNVSIAQSGGTVLVAEVRDKYNNPIAGEQVEITVNGGGDIRGQTTLTARTNSDGQVRLPYSGPAATTVATVDVSLPGASLPQEAASFNVFVATALDNTDPQYNNITVGSASSNTCDDFTSLPVAGLLGCAVPVNVVQGSAEYNVSDTGGSRLSHLEVQIVDSSGEQITSNTVRLNGNQAEGRLITPYVPTNQYSPDEVRVIAYDNAGNSTPVETATI
jgi:hypothetical protein